jgi:hypothetical protein
MRKLYVTLTVEARRSTSESNVADSTQSFKGGVREGVTCPESSRAVSSKAP